MSATGSGLRAIKKSLGHIPSFPRESIEEITFTSNKAPSDEFLQCIKRSSGLYLVRFAKIGLPGLKITVIEFVRRHYK